MDFGYFLTTKKYNWSLVYLQTTVPWCKLLYVHCTVQFMSHRQPAYSIRVRHAPSRMLNIRPDINRIRKLFAELVRLKWMAVLNGDEVSRIVLVLFFIYYFFRVIQRLFFVFFHFLRVIIFTFLHVNQSLFFVLFFLLLFVLFCGFSLFCNVPYLSYNVIFLSVIWFPFLPIIPWLFLKQATCNDKNVLLLLIFFWGIPWEGGGNLSGENVICPAELVI